MCHYQNADVGDSSLHPLLKKTKLRQQSVRKTAPEDLSTLRSLTTPRYYHFGGIITFSLD